MILNFEVHVDDVDRSYSRHIESGQEEKVELHVRHVHSGTHDRKLMYGHCQDQYSGASY